MRRAAAGAPARRARDSSCTPRSRPHCAAASEAARRSPAGHSRSIAAVQPLREAPSITGQPSPWSRASWCRQIEIVGLVLGEAQAGIDDDPLARDARRLAGRHPGRQPVAAPPVRTARSAARRSWWRARPPCASAPRTRANAAATSRLRGSWVRPLTSLMIVAPAANAASMTAALRVSIDTVTPCSASAATTGRTRRSSSSSGTSTAPGRVDSPPTSTMSAPSAASRKPCATAPSVSAKRPAVAEAVRRHVEDAHQPGPVEWRSARGDERLGPFDRHGIDPGASPRGPRRPVDDLGERAGEPAAEQRRGDAGGDQPGGEAAGMAGDRNQVAPHRGIPSAGQDPA